MENNVLIIDGSGIAFRAWAKMPTLNNYKGKRTEVVYNFVNVLRKFIKEIKPRCVVVVWEGRGSKRVNDNDSYKQKRREKRKEQDLSSYYNQVNSLKEWLPRIGINSVEVAGYEADDVIVCLAKKFRDKAVIVAYDSDLLCICKYKAKYINPDKGVMSYYKRDGFIVKPDEIFLYKAIVGDTSDGVSGVKGLGDSFWKGNIIEGLGKYERYKDKKNYVIEQVKKKKGDIGVREFFESYKLIRLPYEGKFEIIDDIELKDFRGIKKQNIVEFLYEFDIKSIKVEEFYNV